MHLVIATRTKSATLQLVSFDVSTIKIAKHETTGRAIVTEKSSGMGAGANFDTYEAFETVLSRYNNATGNVANISSEDLATAQGNVGS